MIMTIIHELRNASGGNAKKDVLHKYKDNKEWYRALVAMYDDSINYYVSSPKDLTFHEEEVDLHEMHRLLKDLSHRAYTGHMARDVAIEGSQDHGELFRLILGRSLKCGVAITTINKIYKDLIPTFPVMLANDNEPTEFPVWGSIKYDGVRVIVFVFVDKSVFIHTRSGKRLRIKSLEQTMGHQSPGVYDGEIVAGDGKQISRTSISGSINSVLKGTLSDIKGYTYCIFDKLSLMEWDAKQCDSSFFIRFDSLITEMVPYPNIMTVEQTQLLTKADVINEYNCREAQGYEGLILRYNDPYVWKRSNYLLKVKATKDTTLICIGTTEGTGKYEGMIGALLCEGYVDKDYVVVKLGTGLSDFDRDQEPSFYIGKDIEALYNAKVKANGAKYHSLFLPRFKRVVGEV